VVTTPKGKILIIAKKLLVTIPPKINSVITLDLDYREKDVFSKFINAGYYTSVVNNTGIPANLSVYRGDPHTPFHIPKLPGVYSFQQTRVPGLHTAYYGAPRSSASSPISDAAVQAAIIRDIKTLQSTNPQTFAQAEPSFVAFSSHSPFYLQCKPDDTERGFYKSLYALQGLRNTFWTGAAWRAHDSSSLWRFNEQIVLPQLVESL
jgi:hypothetical protein